MNNKTKLIKQATIELTKEQLAEWPTYHATKLARNRANAAHDASAKRMGLPKFISDDTDKDCGFTVAVLNPRGRKIGEISVAYRNGYEVQPTWTNTVKPIAAPVDKMRAPVK